MRNHLCSIEHFVQMLSHQVVQGWPVFAAHLSGHAKKLGEVTLADPAVAYEDSALWTPSKVVERAQR